MSAAAQPTLFATGPTARLTDPATCLQAPKGATLTRLQGAVMDVHRAHPNGLTDEELRAQLPQFNGGSLVKRRTELARAGLVYDSGTTRTTTGGRAAIVWRIEQPADRAVMATLRAEKERERAEDHARGELGGAA